MYPRYLNLMSSGELANRAEKLKAIYKRCVLCPWDCRVDRTIGRLGVCRSTDKAKISSAAPHFGEEPMITGQKGSGTIFFSNCNLRCLYCQNYQISQEGMGNEVSDLELANMMIELQNKGCHNINLVSPTHHLPNIISALHMAAGSGLKLPIVYNSNGYEKTETLELLDGIVDVYLPDIKYSSNEIAVRLSNAPKYVNYNKAAIKEMNRQVGKLEMDDNGVAKKGLLVRHLVLPNDLAGSQKCLTFLANAVSKDVYVSIMAQYKPCFIAVNDPELGRTISPNEYTKVLRIASDLGLHNILTQELDSTEIFLPDFRKDKPFSQ